MTQIASAGVTFREFTQETWLFTCLLSGVIVAADVGKALTQDVAAANTFKLAGVGDPIYGRLEVLEDRSQEGLANGVGTIAMKFAGTLPIAGGETVIVGDSVEGAGAGEVRALVPSTDTAGPGPFTITNATHNQRNFVVEVVGSLATVVQL